MEPLIDISRGNQKKRGLLSMISLKSRSNRIYIIAGEHEKSKNETGTLNDANKQDLSKLMMQKWHRNLTYGIANENKNCTRTTRYKK